MKINCSIMKLRPVQFDVGQIVSRWTNTRDVTEQKRAVLKSDKVNGQHLRGNSQSRGKKNKVRINGRS